LKYAESKLTTTYKTRFRDAKRHLSDAEESYSKLMGSRYQGKFDPKHPDIVSLQQQINALKPRVNGDVAPTAPLPAPISAPVTTPQPISTHTPAKDNAPKVTDDLPSSVSYAMKDINRNLQQVSTILRRAGKQKKSAWRSAKSYLETAQADRAKIQQYHATKFNPNHPEWVKLNADIQLANHQLTAFYDTEVIAEQQKKTQNNPSFTDTDSIVASDDPNKTSLKYKVKKIFKSLISVQQESKKIDWSNLKISSETEAHLKQATLQRMKRSIATATKSYDELTNEMGPTFRKASKEHAELLTAFSKAKAVAELLADNLAKLDAENLRVATEKKKAEQERQAARSAALSAEYKKQKAEIKAIKDAKRVAARFPAVVKSFDNPELHAIATQTLARVYPSRKVLRLEITSEFDIKEQAHVESGGVITFGTYRYFNVLVAITAFKPNVAEVLLLTIKSRQQPGNKWSQPTISGGYGSGTQMLISNLDK